MDKDEMRAELIKAGFSTDTINASGVEVLYRSVIVSENLGLAEQSRFLYCDADSQSPEGAREDLKDILPITKK